jgi:ribosomal protein L11 methyltransferase
MSWLQAHVHTDSAHAAQAEAALAAAGAVSVTLLDAADEPVLEPAPGETPLWAQIRVTGLFDGAADADALRATLDAALDGGGALRIEPLQDQVWERAWLAHFRPMRFGRRLWVIPGGQAAELADGDVAVELDPGLAFGTGTHATTALCLDWLDSLDLAGRRVIDVGCGSGILAIAALKLGAAGAVAIDHDPQALLATRENAARNGVADRLTVLGSDAPPPAPADVVVANILAGTLIELAPQIEAMVRPGGLLALSGILAEQVADVAAAYVRPGRSAFPGATDPSRQECRSYPASIDPESGRSAFPGATAAAIPGATDPSRQECRSYRSAILFAPPALRDGWALLHGTRGPV